MSSVAARLAADYPLTNDGRGAVVRPLAEEFIPSDVRLVL